MATPDAINFMAKHGRGLICLALTRQRVDQLGLQLMSRHNGTRHETAFTTSIEAKEGVTTGISAPTGRAPSRSRSMRPRGRSISSRRATSSPWWRATAAC
jgi:3,4-dihydroxy-2-butanone 4-phosphate synthase